MHDLVILFAIYGAATLIYRDIPAWAEAVATAMGHPPEPADGDAPPRA